MIPHSRPALGDAEARAVAQVLESDMIGQGALCRRFEHELANWGGCEHGVAVGSGSAALVLALSALEVGAGSEVILPTYVCVSLLEAVRTVGATPVLCDVGPDWVMTPDDVAAKLGSATAAIVVPHMYGVFADVDAFTGFDVPVIEDCAQALGRRHEHRSSALLRFFSFHPTKCLTTGEGGMCVTADASLAARLRALRDGQEDVAGARLFSPFSDIAAALGLAQLSRYDAMLERRREIAARYDEAFAAVPAIERRAETRSRGMHFRYVLEREGGLDDIQEAFAARGVAVRRGVDALLHRACGFDDADYPRAVRHFNRVVSLPLYPALDDGELAQCIAAGTAILSAA